MKLTTTILFLAVSVSVSLARKSNEAVKTEWFFNDPTNARRSLESESMSLSLAVCEEGEKLDHLTECTTLHGNGNPCKGIPTIENCEVRFINNEFAKACGCSVCVQTLGCSAMKFNVEESCGTYSTLAYDVLECEENAKTFLAHCSC
jgi:hypothetical protein